MVVKLSGTLPVRQI